MEKRAPLGEEGLEVSVPDEGHHEEEEPDREHEQAREGVGGPDQKLVVWRGPQQLRRRLDPVPQLVHILHVEHHQGPARHRDQTV